MQIIDIQILYHQLRTNWSGVRISPGAPNKIRLTDRWAFFISMDGMYATKRQDVDVAID